MLYVLPSLFQVVDLSPSKLVVSLWEGDSSDGIAFLSLSLTRLSKYTFIWFRHLVWVRLLSHTSSSSSIYFTCKFFLKPYNTHLWTISIFTIVFDVDLQIWTQDVYFHKRTLHCYWLVPAWFKLMAWIYSNNITNFKKISSPSKTP